MCSARVKLLQQREKDFGKDDQRRTGCHSNGNGYVRRVRPVTRPMSHQCSYTLTRGWLLPYSKELLKNLFVTPASVDGLNKACLLRSQNIFLSLLTHPRIILILGSYHISCHVAHGLMICPTLNK